MNYCASLKTIFIVCFGVILFTVSHSSISSPINKFELSIGNLFNIVRISEHAVELKLMDVDDRNPTEEWSFFAKNMIKFMDRLPEKKIEIISLGKYHSELFLIIGKDTSADNKWGQMVLRLNTQVEVEKGNEREISGLVFKNLLQKEISDEATQRGELYDLTLYSLLNGHNPPLSMIIMNNCMREWSKDNIKNLKTVKLREEGVIWGEPDTRVIPLDSKLISGLTAKSIGDLIVNQEKMDITLLDRLSSSIIIMELPECFLNDSKEEFLFKSSNESIWPLLYLTTDGSLIPEAGEAEYNVEITGDIAKVSPKFSPVIKTLRGWQKYTVSDNSVVYGNYRLIKMTNDDFRNLLNTEKGSYRPKILPKQQGLPEIKKLMELLDKIDMTKKEDGILEFSQELTQ